MLFRSVSQSRYFLWVGLAFTVDEADDEFGDPVFVFVLEGCSDFFRGHVDDVEDDVLVVSSDWEVVSVSGSFHGVSPLQSRYSPVCWLRETEML